MLAAFELSSLLAANGGDGTASFVAHGPTTGTGFASSLSADMNGDGYADLLISDPAVDPTAQTLPVPDAQVSSADFLNDIADGVSELSRWSLSISGNSETTHYQWKSGTDATVDCATVRNIQTHGHWVRR